LALFEIEPEDLSLWLNLKAKDSEIDGVEFVERDEVLEQLTHEESKALFAEVFRAKGTDPLALFKTGPRDLTPWLKPGQGT
jgi:hypothetical protein